MFPLQHLTHGATFDFNITRGDHAHQLHFSVSRSYDYSRGGEFNRVLDRTALHGVLKTRLVSLLLLFSNCIIFSLLLFMLQCVGILEMSVKEEHVANVEVLLPKLQQTIMNEVVQPVIQKAGAALFSSAMPDPAVVTSVAKPSHSSFRGVFGCQMISFLIQVVCCCSPFYSRRNRFARLPHPKCFRA
jgi:hypothetical protein